MASLMAAMLFAPSVVPVEGKAVAATAKETETARKAIQASYNRQMSAFARKDLKGTFDNRTKDYVHISQNGHRILTEEEKKTTASTFRSSVSNSSWIVVRGFTLKGNTATALVSFGMTYAYPGSENGKRIIRTTARASDTWVKRDGKWLRARRKILASDVTINGRGKPLK